MLLLSPPPPLPLSPLPMLTKHNSPIKQQPKSSPVVGKVEIWRRKHELEEENKKQKLRVKEQRRIVVERNRKKRETKTKTKTKTEKKASKEKVK